MPLRWGYRLTSAIATLLLGGAAAFAQPAATEDDLVVVLLDQKVRGLFSNLAAESVTDEDALKEFFVGSRLLDQPEQIKRLADQTKLLDEQFGKFIAAERLDVRRLGKDVVLLRYVYKAEHYPLVWYFAFYRDPKATPGNGPGNWIAVSVRFDSRLELSTLP